MSGHEVATTNMSIATANTKPDTADKPPPVYHGPVCLSRRLWDWGKAWGQTLIHLVWFWRAAMLGLIIVVGIFAWQEPDFQDRLMTTGLMFVLGALLAIDLLIAFLNLPLLMFYTSLWVFLSLTAIVDLLLYARHLMRSHNRIVLWVVLGNVVLAVAIFSLWSVLQNPPEGPEPVKPVEFLRHVPGPI